VVIGERFAWGHLGRTGGDATLDLFMALPDLIRFADPVDSAAKHAPFTKRAAETRGKVLALNIRRLPAWMLSNAHRRTRVGTYPDFEPWQMLSPHQMAESKEADQTLLMFAHHGELKIDRWLRTEFLVDDFLAFVSEFTEISEAKRREIRALASTRRGDSFSYDHDPAHWFSPGQLEAMYRNNPAWAEVERQVYGDGDPPALGGSRRPSRDPRPRAGITARISSRLKDARGRRLSGPAAKREHLARKAEWAFAARARQGDAGEAEPDSLDRANHDRQITLVGGRRYPNVLELGCGAGVFTRRLAEIADRVVAVDAAPAAIARARESGLDPQRVDFRLASVMDYDVRAAGPWDLVVMSETVYEYGWLHPLFDVGWLASELFAATRAGGRFLMANTYGGEKEYLLSPWLIDTYRDLFLNVGYRRVEEEVRRGQKDGMEYQTLITLFTKPGPEEES